MRRLLRRLPALAALMIAAALALGSAALLVRLIESRSKAEVTEVLQLGGFDWAVVAVDGLQVRVSGNAPSESIRFRALTAAGTVVEATRVRDHIRVAESRPEAPEFSIEILRNLDQISLIGLLPASMDKQGFLQSVAALAADGGVTDLLESASYPAPQGWDVAVAFGLDSVRALPRSKVSISAESVAIKAVADSAADRRRLETELSRRIPGALRVSVEISAPRPVIAPFTLRFLIDAAGAARFDACSADTEETRGRILQAATDAGMPGRGNCTIGIGAPSPRWGDAAVMAIGALHRLGGGTLTISDVDVSLVALETADRELFDTVTGTLERGLPSAFSLTAVLPEPVESDGTGEGEGPAELVATLAEDGTLTLRGRVRDDRQQQVIEAFARGLFGAKAVQNALRLDGHVPEAWTNRALATLQALKGVRHGRALMRADFVEIRGMTGDPEAQSDISRLLGDKLGEGANFRIEVTYDKRLDPVLGLPTAEECAAQINAVIAETKITFAPGSSDLEASAAEPLDRIAAIMRNCTEFPMEIGGHTDSQGRATMNQQLSQARAESVLNALMERRVLTANLTARGYGPTAPIADNRTEEGREANRRIEFRLVSGEEGADGAESADGAETEAPDAEAGGQTEEAGDQ